VAAQVRGLGRRALTVQADLAEPAAAAGVVEAVMGGFGRLDILVNNAGITRWGSLAQTGVEDFDRLVAVNARAPFLMMQAAADKLADGGRVVNISSGVTATALADLALYSGAKAKPHGPIQRTRWPGSATWPRTARCTAASPWRTCSTSAAR